MIYFNLKTLCEESVKLNNRKPIEAGHSVVSSGGKRSTPIILYFDNLDESISNVFGCCVIPSAMTSDTCYSLIYASIYS